jgi:hypothetical protein
MNILHGGRHFERAEYRQNHREKKAAVAKRPAVTSERGASRKSWNAG